MLRTAADAFAYLTKISTLLPGYKKDLPELDKLRLKVETEKRCAEVTATNTSVASRYDTFLSTYDLPRVYRVEPGKPTPEIYEGQVSSANAMDVASEITRFLGPAQEIPPTQPNQK